MGADAFHVCFGVRCEIDVSSEDEVALLEKRRDPRTTHAVWPRTPTNDRRPRVGASGAKRRRRAVRLPRWARDPLPARCRRA